MEENTHPRSPEPAVLYAYWQSELSGPEREQIEAWRKAHPDHEQTWTEWEKIFSLSGASTWVQDISKEQDWVHLKNRLSTPPDTRKRNLMPFGLAAAVLVLLSVVGIWIFSNQQTSTLPTEIACHTFESNSTSDSLTLPDGTQVWLNQVSKLEYPSEFTGEQREVRLTAGEAFFEVTPDADHPFVIATPGLAVEVLGTSFEVDLTQSETAVTVETGKVALLPNGSDASLHLLPGERGEWTAKNGTLDKRQFDDPNYLSWKTGVLVFEETPLLQVISDLERHYHSNIEISPNIDTTQTLTTLFSFQPQEEVLEELKVVLGIDYEIHNPNILLK